MAPSGRGKYSTDSQRTQAIRELSPHFEHKLFLSATPHNGYRESFASLLELLDNQRFARAAKPDERQLESILVRRMKSELKLRWDGSRRFADRVVQHLSVAYDEADKKAHANLRKYGRLLVSVRGSNHAESFAAEFVLKLLKKRMFSSPAAFFTTIRKHIQSLASKGGREVGSKAWRRQIELAEEDYGKDEDFEAAEEEALLASGQALAGGLVEDERLDGRQRDLRPDPEVIRQTLLKELEEYATKAVDRPDAKARVLVEWLKENLCPEGQWGKERVIIFTEYRATQNWLKDILAHEGLVADGRLETMYGGMNKDDRENIKAAFQASPSKSKVRILLATDAASEGINLQNHCSKLIHYEIPWNPNRMEQRNGRVDRHGQKAEEVHVFHFVGAGFKEVRMTQELSDLEADLEFLMRAALKVESIREDLGKVGPVIAAQVEEAMLGRRSTLDTEEAEKEAQPVRRMLTFERKLREQLEKLATQLNETQSELKLSPENILETVRYGLELAKQPALIEAELDGVWPDLSGARKTCPVFDLPALQGSWPAVRKVCRIHTPRRSAL